MLGCLKLETNWITQMNDATPMTDEELREKFESYTEIFKGDDASEKFNATADMMRVVSSYLSKNVEDIDIWPITMVMAEFANIAKGGQAQFIKNQDSKVGRSFDPLHNMNQASLVAAMEILHRNGFKVSDAINYVADRSWLKKVQLAQLRKDYSRGKKWDVSRDWAFEESRREFNSKQEARNHVDSLLTMANRSK